ncbi:MAG: peroxidase-related enzyme, partial [Gracilimonas sp.]
KDDEKIEQLREDYHGLDLSEINLELCKLAVKLTLNPNALNEEGDVKPLKELGFTDRAILDATLVISYFNFVNRMVLGLGVETNEEEVKGYKY